MGEWTTLMLLILCCVYRIAFSHFEFGMDSKKAFLDRRVYCHTIIGLCVTERDRVWRVMTDVTPLAKHLGPFKYPLALWLAASPVDQWEASIGVTWSLSTNQRPVSTLCRTKNRLTCQYWGVRSLTTRQLLFGHIPPVYFVKNICWLSVCAAHSSPTSPEEAEIKS